MREWEIEVDLFNELFDSDDYELSIIESYSQCFNRSEWINEVNNRSGFSFNVNRSRKVQHAITNYKFQIQLAEQRFSIAEYNHSYMV